MDPLIKLKLTKARDRDSHRPRQAEEAATKNTTQEGEHRKSYSDLTQQPRMSEPRKRRRSRRISSSSSSNQDEPPHRPVAKHSKPRHHSEVPRRGHDKSSAPSTGHHARGSRRNPPPTPEKGSHSTTAPVQDIPLPPATKTDKSSSKLTQSSANPPRKHSTEDGHRDAASSDIEDRLSVDTELWEGDVNPDQETLLCDRCGSVTASPADFEEHVRRHHSSLSESCEQCALELPNPCSLTLHNLQVHSQATIPSPLVLQNQTITAFKCPFCFTQFSNDQDGGFLQHCVPYFYFSQFYNYCAVCDSVCDSYPELEKHGQKYHNGLKMFKCWFCNKRDLESVRHLKGHLEECPSNPLPREQRSRSHIAGPPAGPDGRLGCEEAIETNHPTRNTWQTRRQSREEDKISSSIEDLFRAARGSKKTPTERRRFRRAPSVSSDEISSTPSPRKQSRERSAESAARHRARRERRRERRRQRKRNSESSDVEESSQDELVEPPSSDTNLVCHVCQLQLPDQRGLQNHMKLHSPRDTPVTPTCGVCHQTFLNRCSLSLHCRVIHQHQPVRDPVIREGDKFQYLCPFCRCKFNKSVNFFVHCAPYTLFPSVMQTCETCDLKFESLGEAKKHALQKHKNPSFHRCKICHKPFKTYFSLLAHLQKPADQNCARDRVTEGQGGEEARKDAAAVSEQDSETGQSDAEKSSQESHSESDSTIYISSDSSDENEEQKSPQSSPVQKHHDSEEQNSVKHSDQDSQVDSQLNSEVSTEATEGDSKNQDQSDNTGGGSGEADEAETSDGNDYQEEVHDQSQALAAPANRDSENNVTANPIKPLTCDICSLNFHTYADQKLHETRHKDVSGFNFGQGEKYKCHNCEFRSNLCSLTVHALRAYDNFFLDTDVKIIVDSKYYYKCPICCGLFNSLHSFIEHCKYFTIFQQLYSFCVLCKENFEDNASLVRHCEQHHNGVVTLECKICRVRFEDMELLESHLSKYHFQKVVFCFTCKANLPLEAYRSESHKSQCLKQAICGDRLVQHADRDIYDKQCLKCLNYVTSADMSWHESVCKRRAVEYRPAIPAEQRMQPPTTSDPLPKKPVKYRPVIPAKVQMQPPTTSDPLPQKPVKYPPAIPAEQQMQPPEPPTTSNPLPKKPIEHPPAIPAEQQIQPSPTRTPLPNKPSSGYWCDPCGRRFNRKFDIDQHNRAKHSILPYAPPVPYFIETFQCLLCPANFPTYDLRELHYNSRIHSLNLVYIGRYLKRQKSTLYPPRACKMCALFFTREYAFYQHIKSGHKDIHGALSNVDGW